MKPFRVVCIKNPTGTSNGGPAPKIIVGEIYTVIEVEAVYDFSTGIGYRLNEFPLNMVFESNGFRPVDDTFGEVVCEIIEQQIEVEKVAL